jgi:hypothetical protein
MPSSVSIGRTSPEAAPHCPSIRIGMRDRVRGARMPAWESAKADFAPLLPRFQSPDLPDLPDLPGRPGFAP